MARATAYRRGNDLDELGPYLDLARRFPPLTQQQEHALAVRARKGDASAKEKLVQHNLAYVVAIARKQRRGTLRLEDIIQEGSLGLMRAVEKFDPHAGTRFLTYASWWILAYIVKYMKQARSSVRPRSGTVAQQDVSLDAPIGDGEDASYLEGIADDSAGPEDLCLALDRDQRVREALGKVRGRISELGWEIVRDRLEQDVPKTLEEIGGRWDLSRERVRQIEVKTKVFLRRHLETLEPEGLLDAA